MKQGQYLTMLLGLNAFLSVLSHLYKFRLYPRVELIELSVSRAICKDYNGDYLFGVFKPQLSKYQKCNKNEIHNCIPYSKPIDFHYFYYFKNRRPVKYYFINRSTALYILNT